MPSKKPVVVRLLLVVVTVAALGVLALVFSRPKGLRVPVARNVILISIDTCRADYIGCYGAGENATPNIDAFAQQATLFENARTPVPMTLPAHCSMMTGLIPPFHGVRTQPGYGLSKDHNTLAEVVTLLGFTTGAVIGADILERQWGLAQGFATFDDQWPRGRIGILDVERPGEEVTAEAVKWLQTNRQEDRRFLFVHYYDPHAPYQPPGDFAGPFIGQENRMYRGEIAYVDHCIGKIFDELRRLEIYDESLIIVTADHGEMLGEHGEKGHMFFVYESAIRVPLVVKLPYQNTPRRLAQQVSLVDIMPTVMRLVGLRDLPTVLDGVDLTPILAGVGDSSPSAERYIYAETIAPWSWGANPLFAQVGPQWKYIQSTQPELYDLLADPRETTNLLNAEAFGRTDSFMAHSRLARSLEDKIKQVVAETSGATMTDNRVEASDEVIERLESLGYIRMTEEGRIEFKDDRLDAKDLVRYHEVYQDASMLITLGHKNRAIDLLEDLVAECPKFRLPRNTLASRLASAGRTEEAIRHMTILIGQVAPEARDFIFRGGLFEAVGDDDAALADYNQALQLDSASGPTYLKRAKVYLRRGERAKAASNVDQALKFLPVGKGREEAIKLYYRLKRSTAP
ncbi:MAG: sulfatase-like hydrolase/transferase [Planctomycetota bacterium]|jgi:arylsulfatase A-like enzyme/Flp pilus assembly protein TadD